MDRLLLILTALAVHAPVKGEAPKPWAPQTAPGVYVVNKMPTCPCGPGLCTCLPGQCSAGCPATAVPPIYLPPAQPTPVAVPAPRVETYLGVDRRTGRPLWRICEAGTCRLELR